MPSDYYIIILIITTLGNSGVHIDSSRATVCYLERPNTAVAVAEAAALFTLRLWGEG